jgi:hypothetical protein
LVIAAISGIVADKFFGAHANWSGLLAAVASSTWLHVLILIGALIVLRRVLIRLREPDTNPGLKQP